MDISICSYSFHRLLEHGKQDILRYITDCKVLGCSYLDPWSGHFEAPGLERGQAPQLKEQAHRDYLEQIKQAAQAVGLPFGCIAVDGAHIYEDSEEARASNRERALRWLEVVAFLGARQMRIDSGYPHDSWPEDVFAVIVSSYKELIREAKAKGVEIVIENHWGPSVHPEELVRLFAAVPELGLLFDSNNWAEGKQEKGWEICATYAKAVHIKTFSFDEQGDEPSVNLHKALRLLKESHYQGVWGVESVPHDGLELEAAAKTIALIKRSLAMEA